MTKDDGSNTKHADLLTSLVNGYANARIKFAEIHRKGTEVRERVVGIYDSTVKHEDIEEITGSEFRVLRDKSREFSGLEADHHGGNVPHHAAQMLNFRVDGIYQELYIIRGSLRILENMGNIGIEIEGDETTMGHLQTFRADLHARYESLPERYEKVKRHIERELYDSILTVLRQHNDQSLFARKLFFSRNVIDNLFADEGGIDFFFNQVYGGEADRGYVLAARSSIESSGHYKQAEEMFAAALRVNPDNEDVARMIYDNMETYNARSKEKKAADRTTSFHDLVKRLYGKHPDGIGQIFALAGKSYFDEQNTDQARELFGMALSWSDKNPLAKEYLQKMD